MDSKKAARLIDISAVRTQHNLQDIEEIIAIAKEYRFINVHTLPNWTKKVSDYLIDEKDIYVGAPVGFPSGGHKTEVKLLEARHLIDDGVDEMDIVMNVGRFKNKEFSYVKNELEQLISLAPDNVLIKVILEINCLNDQEMLDACELVIECGADFIKTGTGWVPGDANISRIEKIKNSTHGKIKLKAAGGIRTRNEFDALINLGVERFGINTKSALEIVRSFDN